jgi:hypothetical protein
MAWGIAMTAASLFGMLVLVVAAVRMDDDDRSYQAETGADLEPQAEVVPVLNWHRSGELKQAA